MTDRHVNPDPTADAIRAAKRAAAEAIRDARQQAREATAEAVRDAKREAREATRDAVREAKREARDAAIKAHHDVQRAIDDAAGRSGRADRGPDVSAALEAIWGRVAASRRGPRPTLSLTQIIDSAVALADRDGVAGVSMSALASELGTKPMSLYRYVDSKEQLLDLMLDAAIGTPDGGPPEEDWRTGLTRWAGAMLATHEAHPWASEVPTGGPPDTPNKIAWLEEALGSLRATALPVGERMSIVLLLVGYVRNSAALSAQLFAGGLARGDDLDHEMQSYAARLRHLADPGDFPRLHEVLDAGVFDRADPPREQFDYGLERLLDGIAVRIEAADDGPDAR